MKKLISFAVSLFLAANLNAQVVINEIMQSNIDCVMDDLNDFPDSWVELYNAGEEAVNLGDYRLGIKTYKKADKLPAYTLEPKAFVVVYCDKAKEDWETYKAKDKKDKLNWHMSFRLESGKDCVLYLYDKDKNVADSLPSGMKKQPAPNISFGRKTDGSDKWGYQEVPTCKKPNCGTIFGNKDILGNPVFSIPGKVFSGSQNLSLTISLPKDSPEGTVIRYTTDGSEPTENSPIFDNAISITTTKTIRAKLFCKGKLSPRSVTQSYIMHPRDITMPVISIVTDRAYLYDSKIGIYTAGSYTYPGSYSGWGDDPNEEKKNYFYNWRRPMNFEYFEDANVESSINQLGEARITGAYTRREALKSLAIYANKRFGEKRLAYEFFPDQRPNKSNFKSLILRNAGNDAQGLYMRDAIVQRVMSANVDNLDWQAWRPAIVYINGVYAGILNIRERSNEDNIYTNYLNEKGDDGLEDIDMIENWKELKEGSLDNWKAFQSFYTEHGHTYAEFDKVMDVEEFMNVMIMSLFFNNVDFPGNNIVWWRPQAKDGRWRVLVKDTDYTMNLYGQCPYDYKIFQWLHTPGYNNFMAASNTSDATRLFRRLEEDETFLREFIDRFAIYLGDFLNYNRIWEIWQPMYSKIKYEYENGHRRESFLYKNNYNPWWPNYGNEMNSVKDWLTKRKNEMYNQLRDYYKLSSDIPLSINKNMSSADLGKIAVSFNGVKLTRNNFDGKFFPGRTVTLKGENVAGWEITEVSSSGIQSKRTVDGDTYTFTMPTCSSLTITAKVGDATSIANVSETQDAEVQAIFDASGLRRPKLQNGLNIIRTKDGKSKTVWY